MSMLLPLPTSYSTGPRHYDHDGDVPPFLPPYQPGTPEQEEELALLRHLERLQEQGGGGEAWAGRSEVQDATSHRRQEDDIPADVWQTRLEEEATSAAEMQMPTQFPPSFPAAKQPDDIREHAKDAGPPPWEPHPAPVGEEASPGATAQPPPSFQSPPPGIGNPDMPLWEARAPQPFADTRGSDRSLAAPPSLGQQPPAPANPPAPSPPASWPQPKQPAQPSPQTPPPSGNKHTPGPPYEVEASETDTRVINSVYSLSPTARIVYNEALRLGYKTQFMKPGTVGRMNRDPKALATVVGNIIFVDTLPDKPDFGPGTALFHEAFHAIQQQYRVDASKLSPEARKLIENVRYDEDKKVGVSPNELETRRVQSIILQEVGNKSGLRRPVFREYDGYPIPPGTETGRGGAHWSPQDDAPADTPPVPGKVKNEKTKTELKTKES